MNKMRVFLLFLLFISVNVLFCMEVKRLEPILHHAQVISQMKGDRLELSKQRLQRLTRLADRLEGTMQNQEQKMVSPERRARLKDVKEEIIQIQGQIRQMEQGPPVQPSKYTQMEAYLCGVFDKPFEEGFDFNGLIKDFLEKFYKKPIEELNTRAKGDYSQEPTIEETNAIIEGYQQKLIEVLNQERKMKDGYYAFYHAQNSKIGLLSDVITAIRKWLKLRLGSPGVELRIKSPFEQGSIEQGSISAFLDWGRKKMKEEMGGPMWVDHLLRDEVLAINFSPFGNTYSDGESTLHFFISSKSIMKGDVGSLVRDIVFKGLHLPERYIQALASLHERYMQPSTGGNLLQIFIPKEKVDDFVYLCTKFGKPCGKHNCGPKFYDKKTNIPMTISRYLYEYTNNPRSLGRPFHKSYMCGQFLTQLKDKSELYKNINCLQGRILFFPAFFSPDSGVKIFQYNFVSEENKKEYKQGLQKIINQMMNEWVKSGAYKRLSQEDKRNLPLVRLLEYWEKGQAERR